MLIGFFEAGLIPCINVYIGMVYKKSERGKRLVAPNLLMSIHLADHCSRSSIIFAFSAIASAFGGIFAYALTQIRTGTYFSTWRALFIVEGCMTIVIAPLFWLFFPATPKDAWFLTPEEKEMMKLRYELEPSFGIDEEFSWKAVIDGLIDPKFHLQYVYEAT